jgi:hypothetical protein
MVDDLGLRVSEGPSPRAFGLLMAGVAAVVAGWLWLQASARYDVWTGLAAALATLSLLRPSLVEPARRGWMKLARFLAPIGNAVLLAIFFFLVLTPMAIVLRLARRDRLGIRSPQAGSYWRDADEPGEDWSRPF